MIPGVPRSAFTWCVSRIHYSRPRSCRPIDGKCLRYCAEAKSGSGLGSFFDFFAEK